MKMTPDRKAELKERSRLMPRVFWGTAGLAASILLTVDRRGAITLRDARTLWGACGEFMATYMTGNVDALLVTKDAGGRVMQELLANDELVLTRYGRRIVEALEELVELAGVAEASDYFPRRVTKSPRRSSRGPRHDR